MAERMGSRAGGRQQRRLLGRALSVWRAAARDSGKVQRAELEAGFAELERSVAVYKAETGQRLEAAQGGAVAHESRCIAAEAAAAEARAEGEAARSELARVKAAASQLGGAMQARVVAAEEETATCRAELQQALREQVRPTPRAVACLPIEFRHHSHRSHTTPFCSLTCRMLWSGGACRCARGESQRCAARAGRGGGERTAGAPLAEG